MKWIFKLKRSISITLRVFRGRIQRASIGTSGLNSGTMNFFRLLSAALLCAVVLCARSFAEARENQQQANQTIHVSVDRVNVGVIVTDYNGHFLEGLRREDFHLYDNGVEQPLTGFAAIEEPAQVLLLIEAGPPVPLFGNKNVRSLKTLLHNLFPHPPCSVSSFSKRPRLLL